MFIQPCAHHVTHRHNVLLGKIARVKKLDSALPLKSEKGEQNRFFDLQVAYFHLIYHQRKPNQVMSSRADCLPCQLVSARSSASEMDDIGNARCCNNND